MKAHTLLNPRRFAEWLQRRLSSRAIVLLYHRIAETLLDPWSLCVTPKNFAEHLEVLQGSTHPMSLRQLTRAYQDGRLPDRVAVITFDDGYADNLHSAKPVLERYEIPATVFVTSGYVGGAREFWWDELETLLLQPGRLPHELNLDLGRRSMRWTLGKAASYSKEQRRNDRDRQPWRAPPGSRLAFYYLVWQQLQPLPISVQRQALDSIRAWSGRPPGQPNGARPLTRDELSSLSQGGLVEVGAHTVSHPLLSALTLASQEKEIRESKLALESLLQTPITSFAYPFGDYHEDTVPLVQNAGFSCACSTAEHVAWRQSDPFQLPRFGVQNLARDAFELQLARWFRR